MTTKLTELTIRCPATLADLLVGALFEAGATGVEERSRTLDADSEDDEDAEPGDLVDLVVYASESIQLGHFERAVTTTLASWSEHSDTSVAFERRLVNSDWENEWLRHLRPVPIGNGLVVQPLGDESPLPRGRRALVLRPSWAFGDGSHPTTQLAGDSVERYCRSHPECRVLDIGAGSGVLALVALASGANTAKLIDVSLDAVVAARENAELNHTNDRCDISDEPLHAVEGSFDLVVCNINESTLLTLADDLARVTAPEGQLTLTGLISGETSAVEAALGRSGLTTVHRDELKEWVLLELQHG